MMSKSMFRNEEGLVQLMLLLFVLEVGVSLACGCFGDCTDEVDNVEAFEVFPALGSFV